mgnify:CR=1 FL=1
MMERIETGALAPEFELPATEGETSLAGLRGGWVVLYFYPRDFTSGCTTEACEFRDALASRVMDATVLGVSPDDIESHRRFREEHGLPFELLTDEEGEVAQAYGAWGNRGAFGIGVKRSTFIIDPEGRVARAYYNVKADGHAAAVASDLQELQEERTAGRAG